MLGLPTTVTDNGYECMNIAISMLLEEILLASRDRCEQYARLLACGTGERKWLILRLGRADY